MDKSIKIFLYVIFAIIVYGFIYWLIKKYNTKEGYGKGTQGLRTSEPTIQPQQPIIVVNPIPVPTQSIICTGNNITNATQCTGSGNPSKVAFVGTNGTPYYFKELKNGKCCYSTTQGSVPIPVNPNSLQ